MALVIQQKPYGETCPSFEDGSIFCPFLHNSRNGNGDISSFDLSSFSLRDCEDLRDFHSENGYEFSTSPKTISGFIEEFRDLEIGDVVYVEKRSFDRAARTGSLIKYKICSKPYFSSEKGFKAFRRRVEKLGDAQMVDKNGKDSHLLSSMQRRYGISDY